LQHSGIFSTTETFMNASRSTCDTHISLILWLNCLKYSTYARYLHLQLCCCF